MLILICQKVMATSVTALLAAVALDFATYGRQNNTVAAKRSVVATGSMLSFYLLYAVVLQRGAGRLQVRSDLLILIGTAMVAAGAACNIAGRVQLGSSWANHIKIYEGHRLVTTGLYGVVRHPLYASLILMLFGGSIAYRNWLAALLTTCVFVPAMAYRALQEERLLLQEFPAYETYRQRVGMLCPKLRRR